MSRILDLLPRPRRLPGRGFVTLVHSSGAGGATASRLAGVWQVAGALGDALARIVVAVPEGDAEPCGGGAVRFVAAPGGRIDDEGLERQLASLPEEASRVVVRTDPALDGWPEATRVLADDYAARVVGELGGRGVLWDGFDAAGGLVRPGLLLVARSRPGSPDAADGEADLRSFDLRALRRLRDLEIPAHRVTVGLGSALGGWRRARTPVDPAAPRIEIDRLTLPREVTEGSDAVVELDGWILALPPVDGLVLRCGPLFAPVPVDVERPDVAAAQPQLPSVVCGFRSRLATGGLPAGRHRVTLERRDRRVLQELGAIEVGSRKGADTNGVGAAGAPESIRVERCVLEPSGGDPPWLLRVDGRVGEPHRVDSIRVSAGGRRLLDVDPRSFGPRDRDETAAFRVDEAVAIEPGRVTIVVAALRGQSEVASWSETLDVPVPSPAPLRLLGADLERLRRSTGEPLYGGLRVRGTAPGAPAGSEVALLADRRVAERRPLGGDGGFELAVALEPEREHSIDLVVERRGATLAAAGPFLVRSRAITIAGSTLGHLDTVRVALGEHGASLGAEPVRDVLSDLALRAPESWPDVVEALARLAERVEAARSRPSRIETVERFTGDGPPLRVLWVTSEVPWSGHGGGVAQVNWLRELGRRHDVTVAHRVHPGAEGLSDEVRPDVREILTWTRDWRPVGEPAPYGVPKAQLRTYTPSFRAAIAGEVASGRYDLVQYEFGGCFPYACPSEVPNLVALHEVESFGLATGSPATGPWSPRPSRALGDLIARLYFECVLLPDRFGSLATVSEPEARFLLPFLPDATLRVSPIPVDGAEMALRVGDSAPPDVPTFLFVGSFRHPPNAVAAYELVDRIAPALRRRLPEARLVLAGADPPLELVQRARAQGVECPGWVDDLEGLLGGSTALLAPIRTGAGTRVKLLEAMACGTPVVTTALGANGLPGRPGESWLVAETTAEWVAAAVRSWEDAELRARVGAAGRAAVVRDHAPAVQAARREAIWRAVLAEAAG